MELNMKNEKCYVIVKCELCGKLMCNEVNKSLEHTHKAIAGYNRSPYAYFVGANTHKCDCINAESKDSVTAISIAAILDYEPSNMDKIHCIDILY